VVPAAGATVVAVGPAAVFGCAVTLAVALRALVQLEPRIVSTANS
jgi:hypothetical protein